jgi:hypothetical protein
MFLSSSRVHNEGNFLRIRRIIHKEPGAPDDAGQGRGADHLQEGPGLCPYTELCLNLARAAVRVNKLSSKSLDHLSVHNARRLMRMAVGD